MSEPQDYCLDLVRTEDRARYLTLLFAPESTRPALFALYAFNTEIAKTHDTVSEPMIGEIRLQWWREALDEVAAGTPRKHPVVEALTAIEDFKSVRPQLLAMIDARLLDIYDEGPENFGALKDYVDASGGALGGAAAQCLLADQDAGRAAGRAYAMAGLIRAMGYHLQTGQHRMPQADLGAAGLDPKSVPGRDDAEALQPLLTLMTDSIKDDLQTLGRADRVSRQRLTPLVLQARIARKTVSSLRNVGGNPFDLPPQGQGDLSEILSHFWGSLVLRA